MFGIGIYLLDIGNVDLRTGTFKASLLFFLLEYSEMFEDVETATKEAMDDKRVCSDAEHGEKFKFLSMENRSRAEMEDLVSFINPAGSINTVSIVNRDSDVLDHFLVSGMYSKCICSKTNSWKGIWSFSPATMNYPFQDQRLPISVELAGG